MANDVPAAFARYDGSVGLDAARSVWESAPAEIEAFVNSVASGSETTLHFRVAHFIAWMYPPDERWRHPAVRLLESADDVTRIVAARAVSMHGTAADAEILLRHAINDTYDQVREASLDGYLELARELDYDAVARVYREVRCSKAATIALTMASREDPRLLPLVQEASADCVGESESDGRFIVGRWLLGEEELEGQLLGSLMNQDMDAELRAYFVDLIDEEIERRPHRATRAFCEGVNGLVVRHPGIAERLEVTLAACTASSSRHRGGNE